MTTITDKTLISRNIFRSTGWLLVTLAGSCGVLDSGPPLGHHIPRILAEDLAGQSQLLSCKSAPCILFFYKPSCPPCRQLLENLLFYFDDKSSPHPTLFLLMKQKKEEVPKTRFPVLTISQHTWEETFRISRTPVLLFYEAQGRLIRKQLGWRPRAIQSVILDGFFRTVSKGIQFDPFFTSSPVPKLTGEREIKQNHQKKGV
jgi:hypothetical protein